MFFKIKTFFLLLFSFISVHVFAVPPSDSCDVFEPQIAANTNFAAASAPEPRTDSDGNYNVNFSAFFINDCYTAILQEKAGNDAWEWVRTTVLDDNNFKYIAKNKPIGVYKYRYGVVRREGWSSPTPPVRSWNLLADVIVIPKPKKPKNVSFANTEGGIDRNGIFKFKWGAPTTPPPLTGYQVQQCKGACGGSGDWSSIYSSTNLNTKSIRVPASGALSNGKYRYRVRAFLTVGSKTKNSDWLYSDYLTVNRKPNAVTNFTQPTNGTQTGSFQVAWSAPTGSFDAITKYELQCSRNNDAFVYSNCGGGTGSATSKSISFPSGTQGNYRFRARAHNAAGWGPWTPSANYKSVSVNVPYPTPTGVSINAPESSDFGDYDITWNASGVVMSYQLQRYCKTGVSTCGADGWQNVQLNSSTAKTYEARGHIADKYRYRVKACNGTSCTGWKTSPWIKVHNLDGIEPAVVLTTGTTPGIMHYTADVTRAGDAVIRIPVEVAPGVNELKPNVNITYSGARYRQRNNESLPEDYLGYGWQVGGFSSIRRCTIGQNADAKIKMNNEDALCLNGKPLVIVQGSSWQTGTKYRTQEESFFLVTAKWDISYGRWFEVRTPDGLTQEYGRTENSRLKVGNSKYFGWTLNKITDTFDNSIKYKYHRDTVEGINYPLEITYGNDSDARILFEYGTRSDAPPQPLDADDIQQEQLVLLHHIKVMYNNKLLRKYKLISEDEGEIENYRRLKHVQKCAFDANGNNEQCYNPMSFDWVVTDDANPINFDTGVSAVTDSLGQEIKFRYSMISNNSNNGLFSERPFGNGIAPANASPLAAVNGKYRTVVSEVWRSNGNANDWHKVSYAYQGTGFVSDKQRGFLGFYAQREHDLASNIVTYRQYRLDYPYIGKIAREFQYRGIFPNSGELLAKRQQRYGVLNLSSDEETTQFTYSKQNLEWLIENGQTLGYNHYTYQPQKASYDNVGQLITGAIKTGRYALNAVVSDNQSFWGEVEAVPVSGIKRSKQSIISFNNRVSDWLVGFKEAEEISYYKGALNTPANIVQSVVYTPYQSTNKIATETRFPGDTQYELTTEYSYDTSGNIVSETVSGVGIDTRVTTTGNYADKRFPTSLTNPLGQTITLDYDKRFGAVKSVDFNGQVVTTQYDNFGREKKSINGDGVGFTTTREFCYAGTCPVYGDQLPAYQVTTNSPITPKSTRYYDVLGRIIQQDTTAFNGTSTTRKEFNYDQLGRLYLETMPYYVGDNKPLITYQFDIRNRVTQIDRPDGSQVRKIYAPDSTAGQYTVTIEEDVFNSSGNFLATQVKTNTFNFLNDLLISVDAVGTSERTATKYTYNGSGLLTSVLVNNDALTKTIYDYDLAGFRSGITAPDTGLITSLYNALGQLVTTIDNSGETITHVYDKLGRLAFQENSQGIAEWSYDGANGLGQLATKTYTRNGSEVYKQVINFSADAKIASIDTTLRAGGLVRNYQHSYSYDSRGRLASAITPGGSAVYYEYNGRGYLHKLTDGANTLKTLTGVDALGQATEEAYGNGITTTRTYNPDTGRLEAIVSTGNQEIQNNAYSWLSNGTLESRTVSAAGSAVKHEVFNYDSLNRLETAQTWLDNTSQRTLTTMFDRLGNIQSKTSSVASDTQVTGYQYDQTANAGAHAVTSATIKGINHTLHYNQNGAVIRYDAASGDDKWITWNARQLPTEIVVGSSKTTQTPTARDRFRYGPDGQRFYRESSYWDESQQQLITDKTFIIGEFEDYLPGNDPDYSRIQKASIGKSVIVFNITDHAGLSMNTVEYVHRDHLGSVEKITDADGVLLLGALAFDPYGSRKSGDWSGDISESDLEALLAAQGLSTNRGFTNHEQLDRTGLIHMNGRIYDPILGRFLSPDPIVQSPNFSQSWNRYSYAMNIPTSFTDPNGFEMEEVEVICDSVCQSSADMTLYEKWLYESLFTDSFVDFSNGIPGGAIAAPVSQEKKEEGEEGEEEKESNKNNCSPSGAVSQSTAKKGRYSEEYMKANDLGKTIAGVAAQNVVDNIVIKGSPAMGAVPIGPIQEIATQAATGEYNSANTFGAFVGSSVGFVAGAIGGPYVGAIAGTAAGKLATKNYGNMTPRRAEDFWRDFDQAQNSCEE